MQQGFSARREKQYERRVRSWLTPERGEPGIMSRDPILVPKIEDELSITIPDTQGGSMWYRFALVKKP